MPGLVYSFVARRDNTTVLSEYSAIQGNFRTIASECLQNLQHSEDRFTITCDAYTFNYLVADGYAFLCVADEAYGRQIPFACLDRIKEAFLEKFKQKGLTAQESSLDKTFGPVLKREMDYCMQHPEEISKMANVQRKVDEVKGIMLQNVEQVLVRGERLDVLVDRADDLRDQAAKFQQQGTRLRKKMWWDNVKVKILIVCGVLLLGLIIFLVACFAGGRSCVSKGSGGGGSSGSGGGSTTTGTFPTENTLIPGGSSGGGSTSGTFPTDNTLIPGSSGGTLGAPASSSSSPTESSALVPGNAQTLG